VAVVGCFHSEAQVLQALTFLEGKGKAHGIKLMKATEDAQPWLNKTPLSLCQIQVKDEKGFVVLGK
jgi:hypothetical protein